MNLYKLTYEIKSPVITPFQADTIFGHLSWAIRYIKGEERLIGFLKSFNYRNHPIILSDGFPENFLPRPILKPLKVEESEELLDIYFGKEKKDKVIGLTVLKKLKNQPFISWDIFKELEGYLSYFRLYQKVLCGLYCPIWFRRKPCALKDIMKCPIINPDSLIKCNDIIKNKESELVVHNTINRLTGKVQEPGGFFGEIETYYIPDEKIEIYIKNKEFSIKELQELFQFIGQSGYGKDKSIGKGHLRLIEFKGYEFYEPQGGNGFMSLSSFIPAEDDSINGYYEIITKYGKLGGDYSKSGFDGQKLNPFKKPLIMLKAGSSFFVSQKNGIHCGRLIQDVHHSNKIRHYGYAFPLRIKME